MNCFEAEENYGYVLRTVVLSRYVIFNVHHYGANHDNARPTSAKTRGNGRN